MPSKIMVGHDGSDNAQAALEGAMELFNETKPEIILITVVEEPGDASMVNEDIFEKYRSERHDFLMNAAKKVADAGFEVDAILAIGDPRRMLLEAVESKQPDVLVVSKRGEGTVEKLLLGSVSTFLVRHVKCPVLIHHM